MRRHTIIAVSALLALSFVALGGCASHLTTNPCEACVNASKVCFESYYYEFEGRVSNLYGDEHPSSMDVPNRRYSVNIAVRDLPAPANLTSQCVWISIAGGTSVVLILPKRVFQLDQPDLQTMSTSEGVRAWMWRNPAEGLAQRGCEAKFLEQSDDERMIDAHAFPMVGTLSIRRTGYRATLLEIDFQTTTPVPVAVPMRLMWVEPVHRLGLGEEVDEAWLRDRSTRPSQLPAKINGTFTGSELPSPDWSRWPLL